MQNNDVVNFGFDRVCGAAIATCTSLDTPGPRRAVTVEHLGIAKGLQGLWGPLAAGLRIWVNTCYGDGGFACFCTFSSQVTSRVGASRNLMEVLGRNSDSSTYVLATLTKVMSIGTYWVKSRPCATRGATEASFAPMGAKDSVAKTISSASPRHLVVESMESSKSRPLVFPGILYRNSCHACHKKRVKEKTIRKKCRRGPDP